MQYKPVELYKLAFKAALGRDKEKALHGYELIKLALKAYLRLQV